MLNRNVGHLMTNSSILKRLSEIPKIMDAFIQQPAIHDFKSKNVQELNLFM